MTTRTDPASPKTRLLVFIVAYNAETTIEQVLRRIPVSLQACETEILVIDDASLDHTFETSELVRRTRTLPFPLTVLVNPVNQGYGGNQKLGFQYALEHGFDIVALLHGDGQYAPEVMPALVTPVLQGTADAVFGSRMMTPFAALKGGMPLYKYIGNKILTSYQNFVLGTRLSEFHSGYRIYSTAALRAIPFNLNSNGFHFDTEIIIQLLLARARLQEVPIPTYYGDEICHVNGLEYALNVLRATTAAKLQAFNLVYRRNFDVGPNTTKNFYYTPKLDHDSTHAAALAEVAPGTTVLDIGCGPGHFAEALKAQGCRVIGIDKHPPLQLQSFERFIQCDLDGPGLPDRLNDVDVILMLDVIEHLKSPETFVTALHASVTSTRPTKIVVSTGNVAFIVPRLMLLAGHFNYGKRGILDLTHTRLFTFDSIRRLFEESGFSVLETKGIPAPIPEIVRNPFLAYLALRLNRLLIKLSRTFFAYQIFMVLRPLPTLDRLLQESRMWTARRAGAVAIRADP